MYVRDTEGSPSLAVGYFYRGYEAVIKLRAIHTLLCSDAKLTIYLVTK